MPPPSEPPPARPHLRLGHAAAGLLQVRRPHASVFVRVFGCVCMHVRGCFFARVCACLCVLVCVSECDWAQVHIRVRACARVRLYVHLQTCEYVLCAEPKKYTQRDGMQLPSLSAPVLCSGPVTSV